MSIRGVQSNRGDGYQTLIATDWAIRVLDGDIEWLEVDSTSLDSSGEPPAVDDIVVCYRDQRRLYCQCKKNSRSVFEWGLAEGCGADVVGMGADANYHRL